MSKFKNDENNIIRKTLKELTLLGYKPLEEKGEILDGDLVCLANKTEDLWAEMMPGSAKPYRKALKMSRPPCLVLRKR